MSIVFSGHRDRFTDDRELESLVERFGLSAHWIHGGAAGFDSQVEAIARSHGIEPEIFRPDYKKNPGRAAPLIRNREMVKLADIIIVCYDGRKRGGTVFVIEEARKRKIPVIHLPAFPERRHKSIRSG